jgi:hypothetical protein
MEVAARSPMAGVGSRHGAGAEAPVAGVVGLRGRRGGTRVFRLFLPHTVRACRWLDFAAASDLHRSPGGPARRSRSMCHALRGVRVSTSMPFSVAEVSTRRVLPFSGHQAPKCWAGGALRLASPSPDLRSEELGSSPGSQYARERSAPLLPSVRRSVRWVGWSRRPAAPSRRMERAICWAHDHEGHGVRAVEPAFAACLTLTEVSGRLAPSPCSVSPSPGFPSRVCPRRRPLPPASVRRRLLTSVRGFHPSHVFRPRGLSPPRRLAPRAHPPDRGLTPPSEDGGL